MTTDADFLMLYIFLFFTLQAYICLFEIGRNSNVPKTTYYLGLFVLIILGPFVSVALVIDMLNKK